MREPGVYQHGPQGCFNYSYRRDRKEILGEEIYEKFAFGSKTYNDHQSVYDDHDLSERTVDGEAFRP